MRRAPKKFTDDTQSAITSQWSEWFAEKREMLKEDTADALASMGQDPATYFPEDYGKDLGEGLIFVIDPPLTVQSEEFQVPLLSLWWAKPFRPNWGKVNDFVPYQAVIQTPAGDLYLWPHEYTLCAKPEGLIGEEGTTIHSLGGQPVLDEEQMFYLQSRGLSQHQATMLLFGEIKQGDFAYVTFDPEYVDAFAGVGTRIGSYAARDWYAARELEDA